MSNEAVSQSEIVRKNVSAVIEMQRQVTATRSLQGRIADWITEFSGSMAFVYVHAVWFTIWILLNIGRIHIGHISEFDPYPFSLLTLIVSLEAIFLSTFVLISQNRLACVSEKRSELDLQVNLLAEQKAAKLLEMLDDIARQLDSIHTNFNLRRDPTLEALKVSPEPREVLQAIEETVKEEASDVKQKVSEAVEDLKDITGEMEVVRGKVQRTDEKVEQVASDVEHIQRRIKAHSPIADDRSNLSLN